MVRLLALKIILVEKLSRRWRPGRIGYSRPDFITSLLKSYNFISLQSLNMNKYRIRKKPEGLISTQVCLNSGMASVTDFLKFPIFRKIDVFWNPKIPDF